MRTKLVALQILPFVALVCSCNVERASGCETDADCRTGRLCVRNVCAAPGGSSYGPSGRYDAGTAPDRGRGDDTPVPRDGPLIRLQPGNLHFGPLPMGASEVQVIEVFNDGEDTLLISDVWVTDGVFFSQGVSVDEIPAGGSPAIIEVVAQAVFGPDLDENVLAELHVVSNALNPEAGTAYLQAEIERDIPPPPDDACLELEVADDFLQMGVGGSTTTTVIVFNCGDAAVPLIDVVAFDESDHFEVVPIRFPNSIDVGAAAAVEVTIRAPDYEARGQIIFQVIYESSMGPVQGIASFVVSTEDGTEPGCGPPPRAEADRGGPWTQGEMTLPVGHQISIFLDTSRDASILDLVLLEAPDESLQLIQRRDRYNGVLVPDIPGHYEVQVESTFSGDCSQEYRLSFNVELPEGNLVAWAVWPEPFTRGRVNDLDFYVARSNDRGYQWEEHGFFVGPPELTADFGQRGLTIDDPYLNQDYNTGGFGPELITIQEPSPDESIAIGVSAFSTATGSAEPRILVYLNGERSMDNQLEVEQNQFWLAAEVIGTELLGEHEIITSGFPAPELP